MGYIRHHAIIVTAPDYDLGNATLREARDFAARNGGLVSEIVQSTINGYQSFVMFPDGSKEGWPESELGDARRAALIAFMDTKRYSDGSGPLDWAEVQYGDDNRETRVIAHSDENERQVAGGLAV